MDPSKSSMSFTGMTKGAQPRDSTSQGCGCTTCQRYTRGYLRHLFLADELLFYRLASIHNLYFIVNLVKQIRRSLIDGSFYPFKQAFLGRFQAQAGV